MITERSIEYLKAQLDIVEVISHYISLSKRGANYVACCPFHTEKTPSFYVNANKGFFHCFGCGKSGNAVGFVMELEKLNYPQALEKLAEVFNITLEYSNEKEKPKNTKILENIKSFYQNNLSTSPLGREARRYLFDRGVGEDSLKKFAIGVVGDGHSVLHFLRDNGLDMQEACELGVLGLDTQGGAHRYYARLTQRIIFPISNPQGKIVGFGGRTLINHSAKYINSPQTRLFNKSKLLYGYLQARDTIYREEKIIICEGYLDVILLHQVGFHNAVATLGTALTHEHLPLLNKGNPKIIVSYDGDNAGINAAYKAAHLLATNHKDGGVVLFDDGMDPADMVSSGKVERLRQLFSAPKPFVLFVLEQMLASFDMGNPIQKEEALKQARAFLSTLSEVMQIEYSPILANLINIPTRLIPTPNIPLQQKQQNTAQKVSNISKFRILAEKNIVKSMLQFPHLIPIALEYLQPEIFHSQREAYEAVLRGEVEHPELVGLPMEESIEVLSEEDFRLQVRELLWEYYQKVLERLTKKRGVDHERHNFLIRKVMDKIQTLKKGELVAYESFSTL